MNTMPTWAWPVGMDTRVGHGARMRTPLPLLIQVVRPNAVPEVPAGTGWQHSIKLDGHRAVAVRTAEGYLLQSRSGRVTTSEFPEFAAALSVLAVEVVLDGEFCAVHTDGRMDFTALARTPAWRRAHGIGVVFTAFDVLAAGDPSRDVRPLPLFERWDLLAELLGDGPVRPVMATSDRETA